MSVAALRQSRAEGLRPDPVLLVSQWADAHRLLPKKSSAEPGRWRTSRTPYLREIMDCLSTRSHVEEVVFMKAAQIGGTEVILNALGYFIDHAPGPAILVQPTEGTAKKFSRQRVEPLIATTPRLRTKVIPSRSREGGNTVLGKEYPGGVLVIAGANSAVNLRSMPAQYALMDEIDGYPADVDDEGSPVELVEVRQQTFVRRKRIKVSTPTLAGQSAIEEAYANSDRRRYYVPCPDCGEMQPLEFARLTWSKLGLEPEAAVYECRACEYPIPEHHKSAMLEAGDWVAARPEADPRVRGYHLNALYAPIGWLSWGQIARRFVRVHKNPDKFRVFVNTVLGEAWAGTGEAPEWEPLMRRRETFRLGTVPRGVLMLTAGVDVQKDRVEVEVVGWGRGKQSWTVDRFMLAGDSDDLEAGPWAALDEVVARQYPHAAGVEMPIALMAVDSGNFTQTVYAWTKRHPGNRVIAVKGIDHGAILVGAPRAVEITLRGRKLKRGARMWPVAVNLAKTELYGWLKLEMPIAGGQAPPGFCHFSQDLDAEYFKQLTAEQLVPHRNRRGFVRMAWQVIPGRQNHALDQRVYARAAASLAGIDRWKERDWLRLEAMFGAPDPMAVEGDATMPAEAAPSGPAPAAPPPGAVAASTLLAKAASPPAPRPPTPARPRWIPRRPGWLRNR